MASQIGRIGRIAAFLLAPVMLAGCVVYDPAPGPYYAAPAPRYYYAPAPVYPSVGVVVGGGGYYRHHWR